MTFPSTVKIVEVGPRDGLQNEPTIIDVASKSNLVEMLADANIKHIESGSFVNPTWVPQMADSEDVFRAIKRQDDVTYSGLVPNLQGYERAMRVEATEVAIFSSASESFSQRNINCSIDESLDRFRAVAKQAERDDIAVRGYVSCVVACPYSGNVDPDQVLLVANELLDMGCYEISLGDTIGVATPTDINRLFDVLSHNISVEKMAIHFHDTYGQAIANIVTALEYGVATVDSSVAGLGGCPYAAGASGNVATEDVVYLLNGMSIDTGIDLAALVEVGNMISDTIGRPNGSKVGLAMSA